MLCDLLRFIRWSFDVEIELHVVGCGWFGWMLNKLPHALDIFFAAMVMDTKDCQHMKWVFDKHAACWHVTAFFHTKVKPQSAPSLNRLDIAASALVLSSSPDSSNPLTFLESHQNISWMLIILSSTVFRDHVVSLGHCRYSFHWWDWTWNSETACRSPLPRGDKCEWKRVIRSFLICFMRSRISPHSFNLNYLSFYAKFMFAIMGITCIRECYTHERSKRRPESTSEKSCYKIFLLITIYLL